MRTRWHFWWHISKVGEHPACSSPPMSPTPQMSSASWWPVPGKMSRGSDDICQCVKSVWPICLFIILGLASKAQRRRTFLETCVIFLLVQNADCFMTVLDLFPLFNLKEPKTQAFTICILYLWLYDRKQVLRVSLYELLFKCGLTIPRLFYASLTLILGWFKKEKQTFIS